MAAGPGAGAWSAKRAAPADGDKAASAADAIIEVIEERIALVEADLAAGEVTPEAAVMKFWRIAVRQKEIWQVLDLLSLS